MSEHSWLSIIALVLVLTIGGCCVMQGKYNADVCIEQEKTRQMRMQLQAKIDSMQLSISQKKFEKSKKK